MEKIDFHTHLLPGMDDGSASAEESSRMLAALKQQGVRAAAATPHFYPNQESIEAFLDRRSRALAIVEQGRQEREPHILTGAEVYYYQGLQNREGLERLCLSGTDLLLLEMPFVRWSEPQLREVENIHCSRVTVVLAHVNRYLELEDKRVWARLQNAGIFMQINAEAFLDRRTRRAALKLVKNRQVQFFGTDTHNMFSRPPEYTEAVRVMEERLGRPVTTAFLEEQTRLIRDHWNGLN